jgi:hypothetical protein
MSSTLAAAVGSVGSFWMKQVMSGLEWTSRQACWVSGMSGALEWADCVEVALEREVEGDLFLHDIGQGFGFRPGTFDGCIR